MRWKKMGHIFVAKGEYQWAQSHAYLPTPLILNGRIRVYVAFLDQDYVGRIGYVEVSKTDPLNVLKISERPVLDVGKRGSFDEHGVSPACILRYRGKLLLYYFGWQREPAPDIPYRLLAGLAESEDGEHFKRVSDGPILQESKSEPYIRSAPYVIEKDGRFRMWYVAGRSWIMVKGKQVPSYVIKYMESEREDEWEDKGIPCIMPSNKDEYGFGRAWVREDKGIYKMWYSIRTISKGYRIGYAESGDGIDWTREDNQVGIDVSEEGWDSEMICFPAVIDANGKIYMFYNGNGFGRTGFGVAILEEDG